MYERANQVHEVEVRVDPSIFRQLVQSKNCLFKRQFDNNKFIFFTCILFVLLFRYFINLTGQEFPLKTNGEIVEILKILNGANNMEGTIQR